MIIIIKKEEEERKGQNSRGEREYQDKRVLEHRENVKKKDFKAKNGLNLQNN